MFPSSLLVVRLRRREWRMAAAAAATILVAALLAGTPAAAAGSPCGPPVVNPIACENTQAGDPESDWLVSGSGDVNLQGYATSMSVNVGETVSFKIKSTSTSYHID